MFLAALHYIETDPAEESIFCLDEEPVGKLQWPFCADFPRSFDHRKVFPITEMDR